MDTKYVLQEIKKENLYESIADHLEEMILNEVIQVGEKLPAEANLAESFGVSRNIIRESLKILKERHLIEVKNGDGARVIRPDTKFLRDTFSRMISMDSISLEQIYEVRKALDVSASGLCAIRASEEQIKELYTIIDEMRSFRDDMDLWVKADLKFHKGITKASGNKLFYEFIKAMEPALEIVFKKGYNTPGAIEESLAMHTEIVDAIAQHNVMEAEDRMKKHLQRSSYDSSFNI